MIYYQAAISSVHKQAIGRQRKFDEDLESGTPGFAEMADVAAPPL